MSLRLRFVPLVALLALAPPLHAQGTAADSAHWRATKVDLDSIARDRTAPQYSKRAQARIRARDSLRLVGPVVPPVVVPIPTTTTLTAPQTTLLQGKSAQVSAVVTDQNGAVMSGVPLLWKSGDSTILNVSATGVATGRKAGQGVVWATPTNALGAAGSLTIAVQDTALTPPVPPDTTTPPPNGSSIAAQPQNVPTPKYPACTTTVQVLAGTSLQAALNSAQGGTCLVLSNASFVGNFQLPNRSTTGYVTVTSAGFVSQPGVRMTPTKAVPLAKILSPNYTEAIGTAPGAHGYIFRGVEVGTTPAAQSTGMNMLVRMTDPAGTNPPSDIQFQQVYVHGTPTLDMRRSFRADGPQMVLVDSWVDDVHSNNSDSQAWLGLNCAKGQLIQNNTLKAGHEIVMFGGGDPSSQACIPQDIVLARNHITHPLSWYKVWQVKNCIETKDVMRYRIEANVIENCWPDAQAGFAFVMKSENQDCGPIGQYSTTSDVTVQYNVVINAGNGFNLSGKGSNSCPNITAARFDVRHNVFKNFAQTPGGGQAIEAQFLTGVIDVQLARNSFFGKDAGGSAFSMDGTPAAVRLVVSGTALHANAYGVKGGGQSAGTATLNAYAPGYVWTSNLLVGNATCSAYPSSTTCAGTFPVLPTTAYGADTALVNRLTAGVVVTDPLAPNLRRAVSSRSLKYPYRETPAACRVTGKPLPASCDKRIEP